MSLYEEVVAFLVDEAELLDEGRFGDWLELWTDDCRYRMPIRVTRERGQSGDIAYDMQHFYDDRDSLQKRVDRLKTEFAWAEDPPSRTRHFVSNVRVRPGEREEEIRVKSYLLVYRSRGDSPDADLIAGERRDVLRRVGGRLRLSERVFIIDQATLGTKNLAIFF